MKTKIFEVEIPEGHEIDKITFKKVEPNWAESWEGLKEVKGCWISSGSNIVGVSGVTNITNHSNKNVYPTKAYAKRALAEAQLLQLRQQIIGGWVPDYTDINSNPSVMSLKGSLYGGDSCVVYQPFTFQTAEQRDWFMAQHRELLEVYFMIDGGE